MSKKLISKVSASLFVFLLTLLFSVLIISCKKKNGKGDTTVSAVENEKKEADENSIYLPSEDDGSWVEALLMRLEEERIAEQLAEMEDSRLNYELLEETLLDYEEQEAQKEELENKEAEEKNPIELFFEQARQGKVLSGKNNEMRFFEFDNEILAPQYTDDGLVIVCSIDGNVIRNYYNPSYRIYKKEEWQIKSASDAKKLRTENFIYDETTEKIKNKEIYTSDSTEYVSYDENASPVLSKKYVLDKEKEYILMERSWTYDNQNRVTKDTQKDYTYKESDYKKKPEIFEKRYEYFYNDWPVNENTEETGADNEQEEIPPDLKYYENNVLKIYYKYTFEKGKYFCWIYFDQNLSVKTYYEDSIKVRDEFFNNGTLFRTKTYEKSGEEE